MSDFAVKKIDELEGVSGGERLGTFRRARAGLGVDSFGMSVIDLVPNADQYPHHDHAQDGQEEVYVVAEGSGEIEIDGERHTLDGETMVRVGPGTKRKIWPGEDGMRVVAIGCRPGNAYSPGLGSGDGTVEQEQPEIDPGELGPGDFAVKRIDDMEAIYGGAFKRARAELGATAFGLQVIDFPPEADRYPEHDHSHDGQEEVYFALSGQGEIEIDGDRHPLDAETMARVGPSHKRKLLTGGQPMRVVAIGGVAGEPYEIAAITELGQPDPLEQQD